MSGNIGKPKDAKCWNCGHYIFKRRPKLSWAYCVKNKKHFKKGVNLEKASCDFWIQRRIR